MSKESPSPKLHDWASAPTDHPAPLATRQLVKGENMMAARFVLEEGFDMEPHVHHNEQISIIVEGTLLFRVAEPGSDEFREVLVTAGQVMELPPFAPHAATALERTVVFDLFSPPSDTTGIDEG
jgi:quercetin dioxygenase-like cupin family protein